MSHYFTTIDLPFTIEKQVIFQSYSGFSVRGLFYNILRSIDEVFAERLHKEKKLAGFSVSPITSLEDNRVIMKKLSEKKAYFMRFVLLDNRIAEKFVEGLIANTPEKLTLMNTSINISGIAINRVNYLSLLDNAKPVVRFEVKYITPTIFRLSPFILYKILSHEQGLKQIQEHVGHKNLKRIYRYYPFPEPRLLLRSLIRLWRNFSSVRLPKIKEYLNWLLLLGVTVAGFRRGIKTVRVYEHRTTNKWIEGFVGTVCYELPLDIFNAEFARVTDALLKFAEYTNVGGGRTAGLGMIRYRPLKYFG